VEDILADTNVLLRSVEPTEPGSGPAIAAIKILLAQGHRVSVLPHNLIEFWNVATRPIENNGFGWCIVRTDYEISRLETLLTLIPDSPAIYHEWRHLVFENEVSGAKVHGARIVAAMNVHQITKLITFNGRDFKRFPQIVVIDPNTLSVTLAGE
jgi:predicted nucleic acid-binding protein